VVTKAGVYIFLAAVLMLKIGVALQLDRHPLLQPDTGLDTTAYVELAKRVVAGDTALGPGLYYVSPLYIYFLALVYAVTGSFTAARIVQATLGTVAVWLIFVTAREWFGRRAAWIAAVLAALTGVFTYYEALILQASIDIVLTAAALWFLTLALRQEKRRHYVFAGLAFGVASLNRPNLLVSAAAIVLLLLFVRRFAAGMVLLLGIAAGLAPVTIRNLVVAHQWSLVSSHGGINFYIGNGEGATGYFHPVPGIRPTVDGFANDAHRVAVRALGRQLSDAEVSSYFTNLTWHWIARHPIGWAWLLVRKTYGVFNSAHLSIPFSYTFYAYDAGTLLRTCVVGAWLLVPIGLFGLIRAAPRPWSTSYLIWLSFVPSYTASIVLFFITERYQLPLYVPLAIGSGAGIDALLREAASHRNRALLASVALLAALFIAANWPLALDDGRGEERLRMAEYFAGQGEIEKGEHWTALALDSHMPPGTVHYRVGVQYVNAKLADPAIAHLEKANELRPAQPQVEYLLGHAFLGGGRPRDAVPHLQHATELGVDAPFAGFELALALQRSGNSAAAVQVLRGVTLPSNANVDLWLDAGKLAAEAGAPDVAEPYFRGAVRAAPSLARAHQLLALDLLVRRRYEEAAAEFAEAARLDDHNPDTLASLAWCEQHLGRLTDAHAHAEAALRLDPTHELARRILATSPSPLRR
jgi:4-amino-4-deoxy-L-arabinose transferase-like glycosyltransferase